MTIREQVKEFHEAMDIPVLDRPTVPDKARVRLRLRLIAEEFFEVLYATFTGYGVHDDIDLCRADRIIRTVINEDSINVILDEFVDGLADLDYVIEGTRLEFGIDGEPIAAEVHRANMAKVGGPVRADGKRLKPPGWTAPDIAGVLRRQGDR